MCQMTSYESIIWNPQQRPFQSLSKEKRHFPQHNSHLNEISKRKNISQQNKNSLNNKNLQKITQEFPDLTEIHRS